MSFKTTALLFVLVVIVGGAIVLLLEKAPPPEPTLAPTPAPVDEKVSQSLIGEDALGEVQEITVSGAGEEQWKFVREKAGAASGWKIVEPTEGRAQSWAVDGIVRRLSNAKYTVKYSGKDDSLVKAEDAGLEPPRATVTLKDDEGESVEVQIGRNEGGQETFVRLAGGAEIYRIRPSLQDLLKDSALEYHDLQLFKVTAGDIVRISVTQHGEDGGQARYVLVKSGGEWRFEQPMASKAVADKIRNLTTAFSGLRATKWIAADVEDLNIYGLEPGALTVTMTAEEAAPPKDTGTNGETATEPESVMKEYTVHFSDASPFDDETKVYFRRDDEQLVGTVAKTTMETFVPKPNEWQQTQLVEKDPASARRIELTVDDAHAVLTRAGENWSYAADGGPADAEAVKRLLDALKNLKATDFAQGATQDPARFGFDEPRGVVSLSFDDQEEPTVIEFGKYADATREQFMYARVNQGDTVAKVASQDVEAVHLDPSGLRDRVVVRAAAERISRIVIERLGEGGEPEETTTLERQEEGWRLTAPVEEEANAAEVDRLLGMLSGLRAEEVFEAGEDLGRFGLDAPGIAVTYAYTTEDGEEEASSELLFARLDGAVYVMRTEVPDLVYRVDAGVWDAVTAEYGQTRIFSFDPDKVTSVVLSEGEDVQGFQRTEQGWQYLPDEGVAVDGNRVMNYLLRLQDVEAAQFVAYGVEELAEYGLDDPAVLLSVEFEEGPAQSLMISGQANDGGERFARTMQSKDVFTLAPGEIERLRFGRDELTGEGAE